MKKIPDLCDNVDRRLGEAKKVLERLAKYPQHQMTDTWKGHLGRLKTFSESAETRLKGLDTKARSLNKGRLMKNEPKCIEALTELQKELDEVERDAMHLDGYARMMEEARRIQAREDEVIEAVKKVRGIKDDEYKPKCIVQPNHGGLVLNVENKSTFEGRLKELVLAGKGDIVGAVGMQTQSTVTSAYIYNMWNLR